ncbi:MAG TPA: hypothetical protein VET23_00280 [Chitinophagaceae bacterium]|nr:hypothetical protein [Chitinophagaceae bacterium]
MEAKSSLIQPLLERAEAYSKTSIELLKLKSLDKTANVASTLIYRLVSVIVLSLFVFTLTVAIALWIGDLLGKSYYGFLIMASFYGLAGIILFFLRSFMKAKVNDSIIRQMFN